MGWFEDFQSWGAGLLGGAEGAVSDVVSGAIDQGEGAIQAVQGAAGSISSDVTNYFISAAAPSPQVIEFPSEESVTQVAQYRPDIVITPETPAPAPTEGQDIFQQVVASVAGVAAAAEGAVTAADTFLAHPFVASAVEPVVSPGPATEIVLTGAGAANTPVPTFAPTTTPTQTTVKTTAESPSVLNTVVNAAVLLGAGVATAIPQWWDIGANLGNALYDIKYAESIHTANYLAGLGANNNTGAVLTWKEPITGEIMHRDPITLAIIRPKSTIGANSRTAILNVAEQATGIKMGDSPITTLVMPEITKGLQSENTGVRAVAITDLMITGLGDWVLSEPGVAISGWSQGANIAGKVLAPGGGEKMISSFGTMGNLVMTGKTGKVAPATPSPAPTKQTVIKYRGAVVSSKSECWGKLVGTAGCP